MILRGKISLILIILSAILCLYFVKIWAPEYESSSLESLNAYTVSHLNTATAAITPYLLNGQIGALYDELDTILEENPEWIVLDLDEGDGTHIYPIGEHLSPSKYNVNLTYLENEVLFLDQNIGTLTLGINYASSMAKIHENSAELLLRILLAQFAFLVCVAIILDRLVTRPVRILADAATELSNQKFDFELPDTSRDEIGVLVKSFSRMRDDIQKHQIDLIDAKEAAEEGNAAKTRFLSSMSHELRTPMNAILGFGQLLDMGAKGSLNDDQSAAIQNILSSGELLLQLIDDVLDLAKIDAGEIGLSTENVSLKEIVDECIESIGSLAGTRSIRLSTDFQNSMQLVVIADRVRAKQVLLNFLTNAVKYNREGGEAITTIQVYGKSVRISVKDTGDGIPLEVQDRVFVPFDRLGKETMGIEGTGIGLSICKRLTESMNGTIGFESSPGNGSTFWFELPLAPIETEDKIPIVEEVAESITIGSPNDSINGKLILYVEDNPSNTALMEEVIEFIPDVKLVTAGSGEEGLIASEEHKPDLILMDINLPGIDGVETLKRLRLSDTTKQIPVVSLSAAAMPEDIERLRQAQFDGRLTKPINIQETLNLVNKLLDLGE